MRREPPDHRERHDQEICDLYVAEATRLAAHLVRKGASPEMAADVVHDSFLATRLRWHVVRTYECPRGYLYRVAENRLRRLLGLERSLAVPHPDPHAAAGHGLGAGTAGPELELRLVIDEAITRLPPQMRRAARLYYLADHTVAQVAGIMGIGQGTVKGYLREARERLKGELGGDFGDRTEGER
ncbi:sigma-70 family RNA polymerase sigma factor [Actinomadura fulvescens]|uniref:RNA polymerase sigma factor 70 region 4 type 2 domain-containing protein n=1 Tax=Actinomadura fulvescens TaxID=46160 RepID=A0ABP6CZN3_9ACTN